MRRVHKMILVPTAMLLSAASADVTPEELGPGVGVGGGDYSRSVAVHEAAGLVAVGDPLADTDGLVYLFDTIHNTTTILSPANTTDSVVFIKFGTALAFNDAGTRLIVGGPGFDTQYETETRGIGYLIDLSTTPPSQTNFAPPPSGSLPDRIKTFGESVAVSGNTAVIGAPSSTYGGTIEHFGRAFTYDISGSSATQLGEIPISNMYYVQAFGSEVAIDGSMISVLAKDSKKVDGDDQKNYVLVYHNTTQVAEIESPVIAPAADVEHDEAFGHAIGIAGNRIFITDPEKNQPSSSVDGAFYEYAYDGVGVSMVSGPHYAASSDIWGSFGFALSIDGDQMLVTGRSNVVTVDLSSSLLPQTSLDWTLSAAQSNNLGYSVDVDGNSIVIGRAKNGVGHTYALLYQEAAPCNAADVAEPYGVLDLTDTTAFPILFSNNDPLADLAAPFGVLDLADINAFVATFTAGCP